MANITKEEREARNARNTRDNAPDVRGDRGASEDAQRNDDGMLSTAEFDRLLASEFDETALPLPPPKDGWHRCWLTTTSQYDTIQKRQRLGYVPVRMADVPGFDPSSGNKAVASTEGFVSCNEMVLFEIEEWRYQRLMQHFHHKRPAQEEEGIMAAVQAEKEKDGAGASLKVQLSQGETTGFQDMEENVRRDQRRVPTFT